MHEEKKRRIGNSSISEIYYFLVVGARRSLFTVQCSMCEVRVSDVPLFFIQTWHCCYLFYFCSQTHFSRFSRLHFFSLNIFHFSSISCTHRTTQKLNRLRPRHAFAFIRCVFAGVVLWLMAACGFLEDSLVNYTSFWSLWRYGSLFAFVSLACARTMDIVCCITFDACLY